MEVDASQQEVGVLSQRHQEEYTNIYRSLSKGRLFGILLRTAITDPPPDCLQLVYVDLSHLCSEKLVSPMISESEISEEGFFHTGE